MQGPHVHDRGSLRRGDRAEDAGGAFQKLRAPLRDLVRPLGVCSQTPAGNRRTSNCSANSASVFSPLTAANATFALKAGLWFRRGRLVMVLSSLSAIMPIMRGSSTHRPCPDFPSHLSPRPPNPPRPHLGNERSVLPSCPEPLTQTPRLTLRKRSEAMRPPACRGPHRSQPPWLDFAAPKWPTFSAPLTPDRGTAGPRH